LRFNFSEFFDQIRSLNVVNVLLSRNVHSFQGTSFLLDTLDVANGSITNHEDATSSSTGATSSADTVDVGVIISREIVLDDKINTVDVNTTGCNIGCDQNIGSAFTEAVHDAGSFRL
jgi:hypothetical protein